MSSNQIPTAIVEYKKIEKELTAIDCKLYNNIDECDSTIKQVTSEYKSLCEDYEKATKEDKVILDSDKKEKNRELLELKAKKDRYNQRINEIENDLMLSVKDNLNCLTVIGSWINSQMDEIKNNKYLM